MRAPQSFPRHYQVVGRKKPTSPNSRGMSVTQYSRSEISLLEDVLYDVKRPCHFEHLSKFELVSLVCAHSRFLEASLTTSMPSSQDVPAELDIIDVAIIELQARPDLIDSYNITQHQSGQCPPHARVCVSSTRCCKEEATN